MGGLIADAERTTASEQIFDASYLVLDDFLPLDLALTIRRDIETYFTAPNPQNTEMHQVWNYRFVPELCSYLRTTPAKIIRQESVRRFFEALQGCSKERLGLWTASWPVLNCYLPGFHQKLHSDPANGRIGYIYSLTSDTRQTQGGQTLVFNDGDPIRANFQSSPANGSFCTAIEPAFNRLILFDTRVPHAIEQLVGSMAPLEGRFDLHGYVSESAPVVLGALSAEEALPIVGEAVNEVFSASPDFMDRYHGPLCLQIGIEDSGVVQGARALLHRVASTHSAENDFGSVLENLLIEIEKKKFPQAPGETTIILPIMFGGFLPFIASGRG